TVSMEDFRKDPDANPLAAPSGKIEIYSQRLENLAQKWTFGKFRPKLSGDVITPLPEHVNTWEGAEDAATNKKYPLQVIGHHFKARTHSSYGNVAWLKEAHIQTVWMNPADAKERGIENGDLVFVYNDRGTIRLPAKVTARIAPGTMSVPQGAWYDPRPASEVKPPAGANPDKPVDVAGSVNTLSSLHPTPIAKGMGVHTILAQAVKA
ncbi:dimethyl sulfoxide reductase subunit A, partial [Bacillus cereus]|nr:dimethyl sulfoxide reductase subunit A [Bacillus cereus]